MNPVLLIDFGSTYTKITAVDTDMPRLLGTTSAFTTVTTDINEGLAIALAALERKLGKTDYSSVYACSSAAGGLRMMASGLVPELTAKAAKLASLGAGARLARTFSYELTQEDIDFIRSDPPDIFLLAGGTDGGNTTVIEHNAKMLSSLSPAFPILYAGNRSARDACRSILSGFHLTVTENLMPRLGELNTEPVQKEIRTLFLDRIVHAKGMTEASELLSSIVMPTPAAVLQAVTLLADGLNGDGTGSNTGTSVKERQGLGELVAIDPGGATTDVYSVAEGKPLHPNTVIKGLPEPRTKRTVEGDLGMRYGATGILEAAGAEEIAALAGMPPAEAKRSIEALHAHPETLPGTDAHLQALDYALAAKAVEIAMTRHAGKIEEVYTPVGKGYVQSGKDLTAVKTIVLTGGSLIRATRLADIAVHALYSLRESASLKPLHADILLDKEYILAAMGLLSVPFPQAALTLMKAHVGKIATI